MTDHKTAYLVLDEIIRGGAYANLALKHRTFNLSSADAADITALVYETIEHLNYTGFILKHFAKGRLHGSIKLILSMGITELLFMDAPAYAVCNEYTELTRDIGKRELTGFVNGVLRNIERHRNDLPKLPGDFAEKCNILYGTPVFMVREYLNEYGKEFTEKLLSSKIHPVTIRICDESKRAEIIKALESENIVYRKSKFSDDALIIEKAPSVFENPFFKDGSITVQSESAMLVCLACAVKDGMNVLDACAAPGGKTAYLSKLMHGTGNITAWDIHPHRVGLIKNTLSRLHIKNTVCAVHDASEFSGDYADSMDVVLADVPCSGFGGGSKHDVYLNRTEKDVSELALLQKKILDCCAGYVKKGGALVYSTCTVSKRENEDNIRRFLAEHKDFEPESPEFCFPKEYAGRFSHGMIQLFPHIDGTDGFFIARMRRKS